MGAASSCWRGRLTAGRGLSEDACAGWRTGLRRSATRAPVSCQTAVGRAEVLRPTPFYFPHTCWRHQSAKLRGRGGRAPARPRLRAHFSDRRQHARQYLQTQVLFVAQAVCSPLNHANLGVQTLDKSQSHFVLGMAIRGDAVPVPLDHGRELLVGSKTLPLQGVAPVVEETTRSLFRAIIPELAERFLEQVGGVEPPVGLEQDLQGSAARAAEVAAMRQQRVFLSLDELPVFPAQSPVFGLADLVDRLAQVSQDVKLVEKNRGLRSVGGLGGRGAKRLPHVHHRQADFLALRRAEPGEETVHVRFGPTGAAKPDWTHPRQVADHDAVVVPFADRYLVDSDDLRRRRSDSPQLFLHILHFQSLDGLPVQVSFPSHGAESRFPAALADDEGKAFGVKGTVGQPAQFLLFHLAATPARDAADLQFQ